ncbi:hypothetical protein Tco_0098140 [Tanacetum coccineum]
MKSMGDKKVSTIADHERMEATLKDMMINQFKDAEDYAYHIEQETNYMENQIVWESKEEDLMIPKKEATVFDGPQRDPNEPLRKRIFKKRSKKKAKNKQIQAREGKDQVKSKSKVIRMKKIQLEGLKLPSLKLYYKRLKRQGPKLPTG